MYKWIALIGFNGIRVRTDGVFEDGNDFSGFVKYWEFLH